jgi:serine/threonine-protein kinase
VKVCTVCGAQWPDDTNFCPNDGEGLRPAGTTDLVGSVIAERYRILRKLGEGGMGTVYLGEHVRMRRLSAIKVLTQQLAHNPDAVARFNREAANAARINHPHVCAIYDFGETGDGLIYLAMEYIEGEALSALLRREGRLPPRRAAALVAQAADALQAAHDLGIVHRDLKPDNVMLTRGREGADHVKVVDFGIAKAMGGEDDQKVTKTGLVIGTPEYMSPEQLSGDVLDGRSDVYSLALVFYRAITGRLPFEADTAQEILIKRLTDEPLPLREAAPDQSFPPRLQEVLDRALQRMPGDRYPTAAEFSRDVLAAVAGMRAETTASTDAATQLVDTGAAEALPPTRLSPSATPDTPQPRGIPRPPFAPRERRSRRPLVVAAAAIGILAAVGGGAAVALRGGGSAGSDSVATDTTAAGTARSDTARAAGGATNDRRPAGDAPRDSADRAGGTGAPPPPPGANVAALSAELNGMVDLIDDDRTRATALRRAREIYDDRAVPDSLRASAASMLGSGHFFDGASVEACDWARRAVRLAPQNPNYQRLLNQLGCAP